MIFALVAIIVGLLLIAPIGLVLAFRGIHA